MTMKLRVVCKLIPREYNIVGEIIVKRCCNRDSSPYWQLRRKLRGKERQMSSPWTIYG